MSFGIQQQESHFVETRDSQMYCSHRRKWSGRTSEWFVFCSLRHHTWSHAEEQKRDALSLQICCQRSASHLLPRGCWIERECSKSWTRWTICSRPVSRFCYIWFEVAILCSKLWESRVDLTIGRRFAVLSASDHGFMTQAARWDLNLINWGIMHDQPFIWEAFDPEILGDDFVFQPLSTFLIDFIGHFDVWKPETSWQQMVLFLNLLF